MTQQAPTAAVVTSDGRRDFDFILGEWRIANRKLEDPLGAGPATWLDFEAPSVAQPILDGLGNFDAFSVPDLPGRGAFHGYGLRLFEAETGLWRIWWASTVGRGRLDTRLVGRFRHAEGRFECDDLIGGRALTVRSDWTDITPSSARWEQSFSFDGGQRFEPNWIVEWRRIA
jgi:hypothetical protein